MVAFANYVAYMRHNMQYCKRSSSGSAGRNVGVSFGGLSDQRRVLQITAEDRVADVGDDSLSRLRILYNGSQVTMYQAMPWTYDKNG